ncbi:MAG: BBP7 family outer membrane beta-barrel protein [Planctomycetota bacterium]
MRPVGADIQSNVRDLGSGQTLVSEDLDFGLRVAPQVTLRSFLTDNTTAEFVFLGDVKWSSFHSFAGLPSIPNLSGSAQATASLRNFELNWFSDPSVLGTRWIVGLRHLNYNDRLDLDYTLTSGTTTIRETATGTADNQLFGPQFGMDLDVALDETLLQFGTKLGFYNNRNRQSGPTYASELVIDGTPEPTFRSRDDAFTFAAEIDLMLQHHVTQNFALHIGYQGMFLDHVIQTGSQDGSPSGGRNLWLHGLVLGGQLTL